MENIASGSYSPRFSGSYSPKDFRELLSKREISGSYYLNKENIASGSYSPRFSGSYSLNMKNTLSGSYSLKLLGSYSLKRLPGRCFFFIIITCKS